MPVCKNTTERRRAAFVTETVQKTAFSVSAQSYSAIRYCHIKQMPDCIGLVCLFRTARVHGKRNFAVRLMKALASPRNEATGTVHPFALSKNFGAFSLHPSSGVGGYLEVGGY